MGDGVAVHGVEDGVPCGSSERIHDKRRRGKGAIRRLQGGEGGRLHIPQESSRAFEAGRARKLSCKSKPSAFGLCFVGAPPGGFQLCNHGAQAPRKSRAVWAVQEGCRSTS